MDKAPDLGGAAVLLALFDGGGGADEDEVEVLDAGGADEAGLEVDAFVVVVVVCNVDGAVEVVRSVDAVVVAVAAIEGLPVAEVISVGIEERVERMDVETAGERTDWGEEIVSAVERGAD